MPGRLERIRKAARQIIEAGRQALKLTIAGDGKIATQIGSCVFNVALTLRWRRALLTR